MEKNLCSFLTFKLGEELFAANVSKVIEILEIPKVTRVPRSPDFMRGVINLRGNVLPVIDSRVKFGLPPADDTINTCIVVLNIQLASQQAVIGMVVDAVKEVIVFDTASIQAVPEIGSRYKSDFIEGMTKSDDAFIMILNIDLLFNSQEATLLQDSQLTENLVN